MLHILSNNIIHFYVIQYHTKCQETLVENRGHLKEYCVCALENYGNYKRPVRILILQQQQLQLLQLLVQLLLHLHCRRELWSSYSTYDTWQTLLATTRKQSHEHSVVADIYGTLMVSRLADIMDDIQRVHKKVCVNFDASESW